MSHVCSLCLSITSCTLGIFHGVLAGVCLWYNVLAGLFLSEGVLVRVLSLCVKYSILGNYANAVYDCLCIYVCISVLFSNNRIGNFIKCCQIAD